MECGSALAGWCSGTGFRCSEWGHTWWGGGAPGKRNNTFFSHRQIGVAAGFTGSNYLLEQGWLEIWQLREGEKTNIRKGENHHCAMGGSAVGHGSKGIPKPGGGSQSSGTAQA